MRIDLLARCMAHVESDNTAAAQGDDGRAFGRWQMHPAWFAQWYTPQLGDTWDRACARALWRFLRAEAAGGRSVFQALALFHLGHDPRTYQDHVAALAYAARYGFKPGEFAQLDSAVLTDSITFDGFYGYVSAA